MTEKQINFLMNIKKDLQDSIEKAERRNKQERKSVLLKLQNIINNTDFNSNTFSIVVEIYNKGFSNNDEWQHYIWQNTVLQQHPDFQWIKELSKKEG
jgi:hypothetical protein